MNLFTFFRRKSSAPIARERLQIMLAHERASIGGTDLVAKLREEILAVIARHIAIDQDKVNVKMDRDGSVSMLEVEVEVPEGEAQQRVAA